MVTIQTERLLLRPFQAEDVAAYYDYMSDPDVMKYTALLPLSWEEAKNRVESLAMKQANTSPHAFVITLGESEKLIGNCRLARDNDEPTTGDMAYFLNRNYWGRGYATEAVRALIDYGFDRFDFKSIYAICVPENEASRRVMEKAGMVEIEPLTVYADKGNWYRGAFRDVTYRRCSTDRPISDP